MNNYFINEKVAEGERNIRSGHCYTCNCAVTKGEGYRVFVPNRGVRMVCNRHYNNNGMLSYHSNASRGISIIGSEKKTALASTTIGVEIECKNVLSASEFTTLRALVENCMVCHMESDCTVDGEMPTSAMQGLARISKILQSLELHNQLSILSNEHCGAHIHVNCNDVSYIRRYYHSIFLPLNSYIEDMSRARRIEIFGSDFRHWAQPITINSNPMEHTNLFNTQHSKTLEFRLPRIIGFKQYISIVKFWREIGCYINNYDFMEDADAITRKSRARKCGEELVNIAKKYF